MITTEQVRDAAPGTMFGAWRRQDHAVCLERRLAEGMVLRVFERRLAPLKRSCIESERTYYTDVWWEHACEYGSEPTWESAMASAEESARKLFREALEELGGDFCEVCCVGLMPQPARCENHAHTEPGDEEWEKHAEDRGEP